MGQMAAIIAHEVRNPLAIIKATAERIKKKFGASSTNSSDTALLDYIPEEVDRLNQITTHYLNFAAPADAPKRLEPVVETLRIVLEATEREAHRHKVEISHAIDSSISNELADATALRQMVMNLLHNAMDAVGEGGKIVVRLDKAHRKNSLKLVISDNGPGIDKKDLKRVFDPFFTTKVSGTGLGLFVVKRLVERIDGTINIDSEAGKGTKITILFAVTIAE